MLVVFGDTGFLGQHLVRNLKDETGLYGLSRSGWRSYSGESGLPVSMAHEPAINSNFSCAIFCASMRYDPAKYKADPASVYHLNIEAFSNFARLLIERRPRHAILTSSFAVYGNMEGKNEETAMLSSNAMSNGELFYGTAKLHQEQMFAEICARNGIGYSIVRIPSLYGPLATRVPEQAHVIPALIMKAQAIGSGVIQAFGTGQEVKEFLFVEDLSRIFGNLAEEPVGILNVSNNKFIKIADLTTAISRLTKGAVTFEFAAKAATDVKTRVVSTAKFSSLFGDFQFMDFEGGLARTYSWYAQKEVEQ